MASVNPQGNSHIPSWAAEAQHTGVPTKKKPAGSGSQWQALNVCDSLVKSLVQRKFKSPTPIQRSSIPPALSTPPRDILGMARTGSGKTLAYLIPMLQRLGCTHLETASHRALILCPSRELAVQIYSVGKDLARGMSKGKSKDAENLRWALIIGGEGLEGQFEKMTNNPDIVIATPGRFLHLAVEMRMDLRHIQIIVYDEADRLFEMGFDSQLREILSRLPPTRQNLLFSATLPASVAEFAKAGLVNPLLIRLDSEHKISPDLDLRFIAVKPTEKDAALLLLLRDAIDILPVSTEELSKQQAIIFVSTKHHVDYVSELLKTAGYRTSHIYSSLDQSARQQQLHYFRKRQTDVMVVTDVAARGLDIPVMDHVINYDFTPSPRVFIHRVGRTARAGRKGTAWSLVTRDDWPYLFDLQQFLGPSSVGGDSEILRGVPDDILSETVEHISSSLEELAPNLLAQRGVMRKGQAMFERSRGKASPASYRKAKLFGKALDNRSIIITIDPSFVQAGEQSAVNDRSRLLSTVAAYTPAETVFEVGKRGESTGATLMKNRRRVILSRQKTTQTEPQEVSSLSSAVKPDVIPRVKSFRDPDFFLDHVKQGAEVEKGYSLQSGASLPESMTAATMDLTADEGAGPKAQKASQLRWDRKKRKFVQNSSDHEGVKMIRSESGALLPASYSTGLYNQWKARRRPSEARPAGAESVHASNKPTRRAHDPQSSIKKLQGGLRRNSSSLSSAEAIRQNRVNTAQRQEKSNRRPKRR